MDGSINLASIGHQLIRALSRLFQVTGFAMLSPCLAHGSPADDTDLKLSISIVDTYGLHNVSQMSVLEAAGLHSGDAAPSAAQVKAIIQKLTAIPGIEAADVTTILAPRQDQPATTMEVIVYIGVIETGWPSPCYKTAPTADVSLPEAVVNNYREFQHSLLESCKNGSFSEDDSQGFSLVGDEATRAVQREFVALAYQHYDCLVEVLHGSKHAEQRAIAASVIGYASDKERAAKDLVLAIKDPDEEVRNNSLRALGVFLGYAQTHPEISIESPISACLELLNSVHWTDRNKAMLVLDRIAENACEALVCELRRHSLPSLVEMAKWKSDAHSILPFLLIARVGGIAQQDALAAWRSGKRDECIARVLIHHSSSIQQNCHDTLRPRKRRR